MNVALDHRASKSAQDFLARDRKLFIDGEFVDAASGKTFPVYDPATGKVIARVAEADKEDVDRAVRAARKAFDEGPWRKQMTGAERGKLMWKLADLIEANHEQFAELESIDNGKPLSVARVADIPHVINMFRYMSGWTTKIGGQTLPWSGLNQFFSYTSREPIGVVGMIVPWNFPLLMATWKLAPALAAGCTMVIKSAEQTPLSLVRFAELVQEAGFPKGVVNVLAGYGETAGAAIAAHDQVDKVSFTGSGEVGRLVLKAAAGNLKKVTLELGGKSPMIVLPDADIDHTVPGAASAIFFNQGQTCCAGSRLYAHKKIFDKVVEGVANEAKKIKVGPGLDPSTTMGPLVSDEQYKRVKGYIDSGLEAGATALAGGKVIGGDGGYFVKPTVFVDTNPNMKVVREEIFGPVLVAEPFDDNDLEQIAKEANSTEFGLAASVWTKDLSKAHKLSNLLQAGSVWVNCHNVLDPSLPFGGYKQSGWGREMGDVAIEHYTELKAVTIKL